MPGTDSPQIHSSADGLRLWTGQQSDGAITRPARSGRRVTKWLQLARLAVVNPRECSDRIRGLLEIRLGGTRRTQPLASREIATWDSLADRAATHFPPSPSRAELERDFEDVRALLARRADQLGRTPYPLELDADPLLARLAYFLTRWLKPNVVVETGVALGVTTSFILAALGDARGEGRLVSIDRPPLGVPCEMVGQLVPDELRDRWTLHIGTSVRVLPQVLPQLPPIGLFVQDSLFTSRNVRQELSHIIPRLAPRSAVVANAADQSDGFSWLASQIDPTLVAIMRAERKSECIGVSVFDRTTSEPASA